VNDGYRVKVVHRDGAHSYLMDGKIWASRGAALAVARSRARMTKDDEVWLEPVSVVPAAGAERI
jgi:hypothetical protein